jgi:hypothetical protein
MKAAPSMIGPEVGDPLPPSPRLDAPRRTRHAGMLTELGYQVKPAAG